jgi:hypothetical protein
MYAVCRMPCTSHPPLFDHPNNVDEMYKSQSVLSPLLFNDMYLNSDGNRKGQKDQSENLNVS